MCGWLDGVNKIKMNRRECGTYYFVFSCFLYQRTNRLDDLNGGEWVIMFKEEEGRKPEKENRVSEECGCCCWSWGRVLKDFKPKGFLEVWWECVHRRCTVSVCVCVREFLMWFDLGRLGLRKGWRTQIHTAKRGTATANKEQTLDLPFVHCVPFGRVIFQEQTFSLEWFWWRFFSKYLLEIWSCMDLCLPSFTTLHSSVQFLAFSFSSTVHRLLSTKTCMQIFIPFANISKIVACLDWKRLGKQRVECKQILERVLNRVPEHKKGWRNHPAVKMYLPYPNFLKLYFNKCVAEWVRRGFKNSMPLEVLDVSEQEGNNNIITVNNNKQ